MQPEATPTYRPLVTACAEHGISRSVAFELARLGRLETFTIGTRRYVRLESLRTLPERLSVEDPAHQNSGARLTGRNAKVQPLGAQS